MEGHAAEKGRCKKLTWQLTPMPWFLFPPLLCATMYSPPPSSPPFQLLSHLHPPYVCAPPCFCATQALTSPGCPSPPPLVACPPLPPVACPPPCHFCRKGVHMCHHWHMALPCFTPLPSLHPPLVHALLPHLCRRGIHMQPHFRAAPPPLGMPPSAFPTPSPHFTPPLLLASTGPLLTHVPLSLCPLYRLVNFSCISFISQFTLFIC